MKKNIVGIQQIGIGVSDVKQGFSWYHRYFGMDIPVFEEAAEASLMLPYTGGIPHKRHAILAINMKGGSGFEIWQYTSRTPVDADFDIMLGDKGVLCVKMKTADVKAMHDYLRSKKLTTLGEIYKDPAGNDHFYLNDPWGNLFEVIQSTNFFGKGKKLTGGAGGCTVGVSDMDKSIGFYSSILGYDQIVYDEEDIFDDFADLSGGNNKLRRVLLKHTKPRTGGLSGLLGESQIELLQVLDRTAAKIFENRYWGDLGFIHICFDVSGMDDLKRECEEKGHPFMVDSANSFDMGEAAGRFSYIEDPDGTLIEFVETHKIPIFQKLGWYLNLEKRNPDKPLPNWLVKALALGRVKVKYLVALK
jgi:catechol 2,3-dioxygenase-like lactoylglutathione lyase family enzyme